MRTVTQYLNNASVHIVTFIVTQLHDFLTSLHQKVQQWRDKVECTMVDVTKIDNNERPTRNRTEYDIFLPPLNIPISSKMTWQLSWIPVKFLFKHTLNNFLKRSYNHLRMSSKLLVILSTRMQYMTTNLHLQHLWTMTNNIKCSKLFPNAHLSLHPSSLYTNNPFNINCYDMFQH
jgi:hypothetical protein